jgi:Spy/CpxP family protein refolding chaperone
MKKLSAAVAAVFISGAAIANEQPYAGMQHRPVKALSASDTDDLLAGRGMGMALPAELNGYPGPKHVIELAGQLALSDTQLQRTRQLFEEMQQAAAALGRAVVERADALDRLFAGAAADEAGLRAETAEIARLRGELRFLHLRYHLAMRDLLTQEQIALYRQHRGYDGDRPQGHGHGPRKH